MYKLKKFIIFVRLCGLRKTKERKIMALADVIGKIFGSKAERDMKAVKPLLRPRGIGTELSHDVLNPARVPL